ncbi:MAG: BatA domain-containing protein [Deltaproteobacteria bacterium]|nr:BatA domain-containing protein [Deltaproteobacteria bacterium]
MGGFTLLHPWLLLGIAAVSLPVIIHLIGRRRAPVVFFAAIEFLAAVNKRLARREKIRQILLLILRALAILALVFGVTRPVKQLSMISGNSKRNVALVIDTSASMAYQKDGLSLLENAKKLAGAMLSHLQPGDKATIITAGKEVRSLLSTPTSDITMSQSLLNHIEQTEGSADLGMAMDLALSQFADSQSKVTLVVVSDLAKNSFNSLRPTALTTLPEVRLIDAAKRKTLIALDNCAIENVSVESSPNSVNERRFSVSIRNYGANAVSGRGIELIINGEVKLRGYVDVAANSMATKLFTYQFAKSGVYDVTLRLLSDVNDGYQVDDLFFLGIEIVAGVKVLAVNGAPSVTPYNDEFFFFERALASVPKGDPFIDLQIVNVAFLNSGASDLSKYDVVVLANVGTLPEQIVAKLVSFIMAGGGLFFTLGDNIQFERANKLFGNLLPHPLRDLHLADDPAARTPPLGIASIDWDHPILRSLETTAEDSLRSSRTSRYFNLDVGADRNTRIILQFDNGAPALVEAQPKGKGRVMMLTTSIDRDMSDLVLRPIFPALIQRTMRYLAKSIEQTGRLALRQGETAKISMPTGFNTLALITPSKERRIFTSSPQHNITINGLNEVGYYRAEIIHANKYLREPRLDIGVCATLAESDFTPVQTAKVAAALGKNSSGDNFAISVGISDIDNPFEVRGISSLFLLAVCLIFISESLLASRG